jgi:hypothetical protein
MGDLYRHQIKTGCQLPELTTSGERKNLLAATKHEAGFDLLLKREFPWQREIEHRLSGYLFCWDP